MDLDPVFGDPDSLDDGPAPLPLTEVPDGVGVSFGEQDHDWVKAFGGEVTRPSPPVGSIAVGIPGVGFDLVLPDGTIAESYGPDGRLLGPGELAVVNPPEIASEADDEAPRVPDGYSETPCPDGQHEWQGYDEDDCWVRTCVNCPVVERDQKPAGQN